jgi:hypothetical protein
MRQENEAIPCRYAIQPHRGIGVVRTWFPDKQSVEGGGSSRAGGKRFGCLCLQEAEGLHVEGNLFAKVSVVKAVEWFAMLVLPSYCSSSRLRVWSSPAGPYGHP